MFSSYRTSCVRTSWTSVVWRVGITAIYVHDAMWKKHGYDDQIHFYHRPRRAAAARGYQYNNATALLMQIAVFWAHHKRYYHALYYCIATAHVRFHDTLIQSYICVTPGLRWYGNGFCCQERFILFFVQIAVRSSSTHVYTDTIRVYIMDTTCVCVCV